MYVYRVAYRYANGEVEGFLGMSCSGKAQAKDDAIRQISRKLSDIHRGSQAGFLPDPARLIEGPAGLTFDEMESVQRDWASNLRY